MKNLVIHLDRGYTSTQLHIYAHRNQTERESYEVSGNLTLGTLVTSFWCTRIYFSGLIITDGEDETKPRPSYSLLYILHTLLIEDVIGKKLFDTTCLYVVLRKRQHYADREI